MNFYKKMSPKTSLKIRDLKQHLKLMKYVAQKNPTKITPIAMNGLQTLIYVLNFTWLIDYLFFV